METPPQIAHRFREVMLDGTWIANTNFQHQLVPVTWRQAIRPVGPLNTIARLTFHINYYIAGVLNVLQGGDLEIRDRYSFDLPPITRAEQWQQLRSDLLRNAETFAAEVEKMPPEKLEAPFVQEKYGTYRRNLEGMIEHAYYHLGQISLIRKMIDGGFSVVPDTPDPEIV
ncbi:MAG: DinB family protein [Bacteroidota bacterium]